MTREIIYIGDPMCSWCWGFSPVLKTIQEQFGQRAPMRVVVGGLRPGDTQPMTGATGSYIRRHWESVHEATGQPFCFDLFERDDIVLNTEPACRAVVTMRTLRPAATLPYFERLHRAFYVENLDLTDAGHLSHLAEPFGLSPKDFITAFESAELRNETLQDFQLSQRLGVRGFPTIILRDGEHMSLLTAGYQPFEALRPILEPWAHGQVEPSSQVN